MLDRLKIEPENPDKARHELDRRLEVGTWRIPNVRPRVRVDERAPHWWHGDEDASQSFMAAMGVVR